MKNNTAIAALAVALAAAGCRTVPITDRTQLMLSTESSENQLGATAYDDYKRDSKPTSNAAQQALLQRVGTAIKNASDEKSFQWEFNVLESDTVNAFCLPGGKVAVYTAMMKQFSNEAELACVVAHEVGHAIARHYGERTAWGSLIETGGELIKSINPESTAASIYGPATKLGITLPFSRRNEYEADEIGLILMARAGYNPNAAIEFWSRFSDGSSAASLNPLSGLMRTHPKDADRINAMREILPRALEEYAKAPVKRGYGTSF